MDFTRFKKQDWIITLISVIILAVGAFIIFSTTYNAHSEAAGAGSFPKQIIFIIVGLVVYFFLSMLDFTWLQNKSVLIILYSAMIVLLIIVKFWGTKIAGTNRWLDFGFFSFQPSEYAKIVIILLTAGMFALTDKVITDKLIKFHKRDSSKSIANRILGNLKESFPFIYKFLLNALLVVPIIVLILLQPSLGNAIITLILWILIILFLIPEGEQSKVLVFFVTIILAMITFAQFFVYNQETTKLIVVPSFSQVNFFLVGVNLLIIAVLFLALKVQPSTAIIFLAIGLVISLGIVFSWNQVLTPYQKNRVTTFLQGPEADPSNAGYQVIQSKIAIGSGRLSGRGFLQGTQSSLNVLTQAHTDFIFAALSEQLGFIGAGIVLLLYAFLIWRIIKIGIDSTNKFGKITALGIAFLLLLHIFINIGMNLGKLPVTGIPLPLMSYGGSATFMTLIGLGIVQSIGSSRKSVDIADDLMLRSRSLQLN